MTKTSRHTKRCALVALLSCTALTMPIVAMAQDGVTTLPVMTISDQLDSDETSIVAQTNTAGGKMAADTLDTAGSISVITQKDMQNRAADTLEDVLRYTSGVLVDEWGGGDNRYDSFRIRGFDQQTTGTFRDGLPVYGDGWTYIRQEPYAFERIEVLKGSNSTLFGMSAPGGIVNGVTKMPKPKKFGEVYTTLGKHHTEFGTDFGDVSADGVWSYRLTAKWQDAEPSHEYSRDDRRYLGFAIGWAPTAQTDVTFMAGYNKRDGWPGSGTPLGSDLDPDVFLGEPDFNRFDTVEKSVGYQLRHDFGNGLTLRQTARYSHMDLMYETVYGASLTPMSDRTGFMVDSNQHQFAIDNQLQYDTTFAGMDSRTLVGIEYNRIRTKEDVQYGVAGGIDIHNINYCGRACVTLGPYLNWSPTRETTAGYIQQELTIAEKWILTFGGRYDSADVTVKDYNANTTQSQTFNNFSKRIGLTYRVTDEVSVYGNYSESFEPNVWNLAQKAKEGKQYEIGAKYRPAGANALYSIAAFDLTQTNVDTQVSPAITRQIGKIGVRGIEAEAKYELTRQFNVSAAYSWWNADIREDGIVGNKGKTPSRVPRHIASIWGEYTLQGTEARGDVTLGGGVRYVGSTFGDDQNTVRIPSHTLWDATVRYQVTEQTTLALNVSNLFDKQYYATNYYGENYNGDGRTITATLRYTW